MQYPTDKISKDAKYYALEFLVDDNDQTVVGGYTGWVGWADSEMRVELREPSLVRAERMAEIWTKLQRPFHVVNDVDDFLRWFLLGGHALIEKIVATELIPDSLKPVPYVQTGNRGFTALGALPRTLFRPAPTPKQRMAIIKRDDYRCRVCGRRPENHVDIELHVHHIRPHSQGGPTHADNLITLCDTCHRGLDPHYEYSLYTLLEEPGTDLVSRERSKYLKGVQAYRAATQRFLKELNGPKDA